MEAAYYFKEVEKYLDSFKLQIEDEKKEIAESQKKFSNLVNSFSQKAPSSSVINSLFKDEEREGFVFSKHEEKRKQLAEQRKAEYNAYLEKKEAELLMKKRISEEKKSVSPKSILDSVDYEQILAKRKEEEAKFRNVNIADILHHYEPVLNEDGKKPDLNTANYSLERFPLTIRNDNISLPASSFPGTSKSLEEFQAKLPVIGEKKSFDALAIKENAQLIEERLAKQLEEQRRLMFLEFENELRKNNIIKEEIQSLKSSHSVKSLTRRPEEFPKIGRTGGGGDPVRDSYGNLLTMRGLKKENDVDYGSVMSFPSMQQQPIKDRMAIYREELQKQIEDKKRLEALEKSKALALEERIAQRIEEQRLKMSEEYENELKKNNKIKEEFQRQQERIRKLEEFQRKDAEARRKKLSEVKSPPTVKVQPEPVVQERSNSPPIPSVRTKVLLEKAVEAAPLVKPENVFSSLAEIRRKIKEEQQKSKNSLKKSYEVMNRRAVQEVSDDEDDDVLRSSINSHL